MFASVILTFVVDSVWKHNIPLPGFNFPHEFFLFAISHNSIQLSVAIVDGLIITNPPAN